MKNLLGILLLAIIGINPIMAKKSSIDRIGFRFPTDCQADRQFSNLDYGLRIQVSSDIDESRIVDKSELTTKELKNFPAADFENSLQSAAEEFLDNLCSNLGFKVGGNASSCFILKVRITDCKLRVRSYNPKSMEAISSAAVVINWELLNPDREEILSRSTSSGRASSSTLTGMASAISEAYLKAFSGIGFDRIASELKVAKTARQEANKQVGGSGNTALEHTVIRWFINSSPQGADVSWRVVSSTPDVANTNSNYVGTTPYESTESFDIRGLTYNNSGNVQIEVTCERPGYLSQKKRFNLRQVIDQKEISAKFNLVKETTDLTEE